MPDQETEDDSQTDNDFPIQYTSLRAVYASLTSVLLSTVLFGALISLVSDFPITSFSVVEYEFAFSNLVWIVLLTAFSVGTSASTTYWYHLNVSTSMSRQLPSVGRYFLISLLIILPILWITGFLRMLVALGLLLSTLVGIFVTPFLILYYLLKKRGAELYWATSLAVATFVTVLIVEIADTVPDTSSGPFGSNLLGVICIYLLAMGLPEFVGNLKKEEHVGAIDRSVVEDLDSVLREVDYMRLADHGFEMPYRRAAIDVESVDAARSVVLSPGGELDDVEGYLNYYLALSEFEDRLKSLEQVIDDPTPTTRALSQLLMFYVPQTTATDPDTAADLMREAVEILGVYEDLIDSDADAVASLEARVIELSSETTSESRQSTADMKDALAAIRDDYA